MECMIREFCFYHVKIRQYIINMHSSPTEKYRIAYKYPRCILVCKSPVVFLYVETDTYFFLLTRWDYIMPNATIPVSHSDNARDERLEYALFYLMLYLELFSCHKLSTASFFKGRINYAVLTHTW